jgi:hypothetical protein
MTTAQTFSWAIVLAIAWVGLQAWQNDERDLVKLASSGVFFFVVAFFSMRVSSRLTSWTQARFAKPPPPPAAPIAATSDRPEHAQRRREKRRKRSYRRKR